MKLDGKRHRAGLSIEAMPIRCAPAGVLGALAERRDPILLDSAALSEHFGRYSVLTCEPLELLTLREGVLTDRAGRTLAETDDGIWQCLDSAFECVELAGTNDEQPYGPGWFGYVGYELGRHIERLPGRAGRDTAFPDLRLGFHDAAMIYDAIEQKWWLAELVFDDPPDGAGAAGRALREIAASAMPGADDDLPRPVQDARPDGSAGPAAGRVESNFTPAQYRRALGRCIDYIAAGDIFQVNLSQRFEVPDAPRPIEIYSALRKRNPAWYAAYMSFTSAGHNCAVVSCSPELFLSVHGRDVTTRPIKGTRPRVGLAGRDRDAAAELLASDKDNAELAMIIDLLRNDLGRVCRFGSVRVTEPRRLETHPTVFHLVGTITGRLRDEIGQAGLLRATLPGGSITGAPKIRAMQIIDELEPVARGVYTGCVGYVGLDGRAEWNIAIRTIVCQDSIAYVQVGGGVVADSTPDGEYDETLTKARAMLEAIAEARRACAPASSPANSLASGPAARRRRGDTDQPQPAKSCTRPAETEQ